MREGRVRNRWRLVRSLDLALLSLLRRFLGVLVFASCLFVSACTPKYELVAPALLPAVDAQVWPAAPQPARYAYAGTLIGEQDFVVETKDPGGMETALRWIAGLIIGPPQFVELIRPVAGLTSDDGTRVFIADAGHKAIMVFDMTERKLLKWPQPNANTGFLSPVGLVDDGEGGLYVSDAELGRIFHLNAEGEPIGEFGGDVLERPTGLARNPATGEIYVADTATHEVKIFDKGGRLVDIIGCHGVKMGCFNRPTHLTFSDGRLYVSDTLNFRVQVFDENHDPQLSVGENGTTIGNMARPKGVAVGGDDRIYVVESYYDHLLVFAESGRFLLPIGGTGKGVGRFYLPAGVWTDRAGRVYVADMFNGRIAVFYELTVG